VVVCQEYDDDDIFISSSFYFNGGAVVAVTDAPGDGLRSFVVTLREIELLSNEVEPQTLYRDPEGFRVDLLRLRGAPDSRLHEFAAAAYGLPVAAYRRVRLTISDPLLILDTGERVEGSRIDLVGGGRIELGLSDPFFVEPDLTRLLVLDVDVSRSVQPPDDAGGRWSVRPLVLADSNIEDSARAFPTPVDVEGEVLEVGDQGAIVLDLSNGRGRIRVPAGSAAVYDASGVRSSLEAIEEGTWAHVRGRVKDGGVLEPQAIALGRLETRIGVVSSSATAVATDGTVEHRVVLRSVVLRSVDSSAPEAESLAAPSPEGGSPNFSPGNFTVSVGPETRFSVARVTETDVPEWLPGTELTVIGWPSRVGMPTRALWVDVGAEMRQGRVERVSSHDGRVVLDITTASGGSLDLEVEAKEPVFFGGRSDLSVDGLAPGDAIQFRHDSDIDWTSLEVAPPSIRGVVTAVDPAERALTLETDTGLATVYVSVHARILRLEVIRDALVEDSIALAEIEEGLFVETRGAAEAGLEALDLTVTSLTATSPTATSSTATSPPVSG